MLLLSQFFTDVVCVVLVLIFRMVEKNISCYLEIDFLNIYCDNNSLSKVEDVLIVSVTIFKM